MITLVVFILGRTLDISAAQSDINSAKDKLRRYRESVDTFHGLWYADAVELATSIDVTPSIPRRCGRMSNRSNVPADNPEEFYRRSITVPLLGILLFTYYFVMLSFYPVIIKCKMLKFRQDEGCGPQNQWLNLQTS